jgi:hypothetical protein
MRANSYQAGNEFREAGDRARGSDAAPPDSKYKIGISLAIAVVTLIGALTTWRAATALDAAAEADSNGITAVRDWENAHVEASFIGYRGRQSYADIYLYEVQAQALRLERQQSGISPEQGARFDERILEASQRADSMKAYRAPGDYARPDNPTFYDLQRHIGERLAGNIAGLDVGAQRHFDRADDQRARARGLMALLLILGIALVGFTVAYDAHGLIRYVWVVPAAGLLLAAGAYVAVVELL